MFRKTTAAALALLIVMSLAACAKNDNRTATAVSSAASAGETAITPVPVKSGEDGSAAGIPEQEEEYSTVNGAAEGSTGEQEDASSGSAAGAGDAAYSEPGKVKEGSGIKSTTDDSEIRKTTESSEEGRTTEDLEPGKARTTPSSEMTKGNPNPDRSESNRDPETSDRATTGDGTTTSEETAAGDETITGDGTTKEDGTTASDGTTKGDGTTASDGTTTGDGSSSTENIAEENAALKDTFVPLCQYPELPNGCEVTSLTMVLNHFGVPADKCDISDNYLAKGPVGTVDFYKAFEGNPRDADAFGCYAPVIVDTANKYISAHNSDLTVEDLTGTALEDLFSYVDKGIPVIVWATQDCKEGHYSVTWNVDGEDMTWFTPEHCLVLIGYDDKMIWTADPMYGDIRGYLRSVFEKRFESLYRQAIVISQ